MKLINKILTSIAPIAIVGITTPTLIACSKGSNFTIKYSDNINCLYVDQENYHSVDEVRNEIKNKIDLETTKQEISVGQLNSELRNKTIWYQILYYEIIASYITFNDPAGISLVDWSESNGSITSFKLNNGLINGLGETKFEYKNENNKVYIYYSTIHFQSYTYKLCSATE